MVTSQIPSMTLSMKKFSHQLLTSEIIILLLGCVTLITGTAAYSHQTFPWTICRSVGASVCPVHCGKMADQIWMPFGITDQTGPGMRHVVGFGDRSTGRGTFGANLGHAIVANGNLLSQRHGPLPKILWADLLLLTFNRYDYGVIKSYDCKDT